MADTFDRHTAINDIRDGMPLDVRAAWDCARANEDYYDLKNRLYLENLAREENETASDWDARPKQYSRLTRRAVHCLTDELYSPGPTRALNEGSAAAKALFASIYEENHVSALLQRADRKATLNGTCAVQVVGTGDPAHPVRFYLWGAQEFHPYFAGDDPIRPAAIVTKEIISGAKRNTKRRRWTLWTPENIQRFESKDFDASSPEGTTAAYTGPVESNPYRVIPFAYIWHELPVDRFAVEGIGTALREANGEVDRMLTDLACLLEAYNRPKGFIRNVSSAWRFAERIGAFTRLPSENNDLDSPAQPEPFYLQPAVDVVSAWEHIRNFLNTTFTDLDIPLEAAGGTAALQGDPSGIALAIRNEPLRKYLKARQVAFAVYERDLARLVLWIAGSYGGHDELAALAADATITLAWPAILMGPPTAETDSSDQWAYQMGMESLATILMRRNGWSRDQAQEHLEQVAADRAKEPTATAAQPTAGSQDGSQNQGAEDESEDDPDAAPDQPEADEDE